MIIRLNFTEEDVDYAFDIIFHNKKIYRNLSNIAANVYLKKLNTSSENVLNSEREIKDLWRQRYNSLVGSTLREDAVREFECYVKNRGDVSTIGHPVTFTKISQSLTSLNSALMQQFLFGTDELNTCIEFIPEIGMCRMNRGVNALKRAGIFTIKDLKNYVENSNQNWIKSLMGIKNVGLGTIELLLECDLIRRNIPEFNEYMSLFEGHINQFSGGENHEMDS